MAEPFPGLTDAARRLLSAVEQRLLDEALAGAARGAGNAAAAVRENLVQKATDNMSMLAKLPREVAHKVTDLYRGVAGRMMTAGELAAVREAFPHVSVYLWSLVRVVDGAGLSALAKAAFHHGNPAITLGRTIYLKQGNPLWDNADLSRSNDGRETMVHESTHVIQYTELGYARFGGHYAADMIRVRGDDNKLYQYWERKDPFAAETLEGEAEMVGNYGRLRSSRLPTDQARLQAAAAALKGTGTYGL